jgi:hypothetical protein
MWCGHVEESMSSEAQAWVLVHATEELLEEYVFGRVQEPDLSRLEEHLLICPECQSELLAVEEYTILMKAGLAAFERERRAAPDEAPDVAHGDIPAVAPTAASDGARNHAPPRRAPSPGAPSVSVASPRFVFLRSPIANIMLAAALLLLVTATVAWRMQPSTATTPSATVKLIAFRGGDDDIARAPAGRPLDLVIDRTNLPPDVSYRAEVVSSSGLRIWSGSAHITEQNLSARLAIPLHSGVYWVRLYSSGGQLLREFGLHVT